MSGLVKRLRYDAKVSSESSDMWQAFDCSDVMREAAAKIEQLERELAAEKALADDLEKVARGVSWDHPARTAYRKARGL